MLAFSTLIVSHDTSTSEPSAGIVVVSRSFLKIEKSPDSALASRTLNTSARREEELVSKKDMSALNMNTSIRKATPVLQLVETLLIKRWKYRQLKNICIYILSHILKLA